jgi:hypothetical protein
MKSIPLIAAIVAIAPLARAAAKPAVVIVFDTPDPIVDRLVSEAAVAGLAVSRRIMPSVDPSALASMAEAGGAQGFAVVRGDRVEVWIVTDGLAFLESIARGDDDATAALRAVERLRIALVPKPAEAAAPIVERVEEPAPHRAFAAFAGLGVAAAAGGIPAFPTASVSIAAEFGPLRVGAIGALPIAASRIARDSGEAETRVSSAAATLGWVQPLSSRWRVDVTLGIGLLHLDARGAPSSAAFVGTRSSAITPWVSAGGGLAFVIAGPLRARIEARLGAPTAPLDVAFLGTAEAGVRFPFVTSAVGIEGVW